MDDRKKELLERMAAKGLYIADLLAIDEYEQRKKDAEAEKEAARNSKDLSPLINTAERNTANRARMSEGIQAAADKYMDANREALRKLFLGLPSVKEASKTDKGKRDVEKWLAKQLARGGEFYKEILNNYDENAKSRLGELRPLTEADIRKAGRNLANYQTEVRGAGDIRKQELQGYLVANAQTEAPPQQKKAAEADVRKELLEDIAHGKEGRVLNRKTNKFEKAHWDVPRDIPPEYMDPIILLMNLFDASGLAPGSYSPPPSPAEPPVSDGLVQGDASQYEKKQQKLTAKEWLDDPIYKEAHDSYFSNPKSPLPEDWEMGYPFAIYALDGSSDIIVFDEDGSLPRDLTEDDDDYGKFKQFVYVPGAGQLYRKEDAPDSQEDDQEARNALHEETVDRREGIVDSNALMDKWQKDPVYRAAWEAYGAGNPLPEGLAKEFPFAIWYPDSREDKIIVFEEGGKRPFLAEAGTPEYKKFKPYVYMAKTVSDSRMKKRKRRKAEKGMTHVGKIGALLTDDVFRFWG